MSTNFTTDETGENVNEVCARCGHTTPQCARCGRSTQFLGGMVEGKLYCHTFSAGSEQMSCYTAAIWEGARWR